MLARFIALGCLLALTHRVGGQPPQRDYRSAPVVARLGKERGNLEAVVFSPDGKLLATVARDEKRVRLWDVAGKKELSALAAPEVVWSIQFSPDGTLLAAGCINGTVQVWHVARGEERGRIPGKGSHTQIMFSADGKTLYAGSQGRAQPSFEICEYEIPGGKIVSKADLEPKLGNLVLSPDARWVVWDGYSGPLQIRNLQTRQQRTLPVSFGVRVAFSPDGRLLATAGPGLSIQIWEMATGSQRLEFRIPSLPGRLALAPDGRTIASHEGDDGYRLWDLEAGDSLAAFPGSGKAIAFSPDGRWLASAGNDCTVELRQLHREETFSYAILSGRMLEKLWNELGDDAGKAHKTISTLTYFPADALPFLQRKLGTYVNLPCKSDEALLAKVIADLDGDRFEGRQQATDKLEELGEQARPALEKALVSQPPLEVRQRIEGVLKVLNGLQVQPSPETMRMLRGVEVLERVGTEGARKVLQELAGGREDIPVCRQAQEALERLQRQGR